MYQSKQSLVDRIVNNLTIDYSIKNKKNSGEIGNFLEKFFIDNIHKKNSSDIPNLELKTKNIQASSKYISLATYTNPKNALERTYEKIKNHIGYIEYEYLNRKIYIRRFTIFKKCDIKEFRKAVNIRGGKEFSLNISANYLPIVFKSYDKVVA